MCDFTNAILDGRESLTKPLHSSCYPSRTTDLDSNPLNSTTGDNLLVVDLNNFLAYYNEDNTIQRLSESITVYDTSFFSERGTTYLTQMEIWPVTWFETRVDSGQTKVIELADENTACANISMECVSKTCPDFIQLNNKY